MPDHVLTQKVRRPGAAGLWRSRLIDPLLRPGAPRVAVVLAPAGCGKTTLLAHIASAVPGTVAWYRAGAEDSSEVALVRHLGVALDPTLRTAGLGAPTSMDQLLGRLDEWSGDPAVLVVDDVHEVAGTPAEKALGRLLELGPPQLRILLGSRRRPTVNLSRLQVADVLLQLDGDDLRFRSWEVEQLFDHVYGERLPPESSAALSRRTQGWAAGLQMFHLATAGGTTAERRSAVEALSGRSRLIRCYLADNVLGGLDPDRRTFLVRTCALGLLSGPLCDELLGTTGSEVVLRRLEEDQLFTTSDDDGLTFRYHQVLQDHLEVVLHEELGHRGAQAWYGRSARLLESRGHVCDALRAYARAEDWASAAQLLTRAGDRMADDGHRGWDSLPADLRERDPWLTVAEARYRLRRGAVAAAVGLFRHAETLLADPGFQEQCRRERMLASVWLPEYRDRPPPPVEAGGANRHWVEQLRGETLRLRHRAEDPTGHRTTGDRLVLGLSHLLAGRSSDAEIELAGVCDESEPESLEQVAAMTAYALLLALTGRTATAQLEAAALAADVSGHPWLERLSRAALRSVVTGAPEDAGAGSWDGVVQESQGDGDEWGTALLQLLRGAFQTLSQPVRDPARAPAPLADTRSLEDAGERFRRMRSPVLAAWADAVRALDLARRGVPGAAEAAVRVDTIGRTLNIPGVQALASFSLGVLDRSGARPEVLVTRLREECGVAAAGDAALPAWRAAPHVQAEAPCGVEIHVRLLGGFRFELGGRELSWDGVRPRALTLLRMLATAPDTDVHRERLVDLLWPDADLVAGTRRLQVAVSSVRHAMDTAGLPGRDVLVRHADAYRFVLPRGARMDTGDLARALSVCSAARRSGDRGGAISAARLVLELYRGELLPEDGPAEWVAPERDRLRLLVAVTARQLAEDCRAVGDVPGVILAARRSLDLDPFQDASWGLLAVAHDLAGDGSAAARARREQARMAAELVGPGRG